MTRAKKATPAVPAVPATVSPEILAMLQGMFPQLAAQVAAKEPAKPGKPLTAATWNAAGYLDLSFEAEVEVVINGQKARIGRSRGKGNTYIRKA